MSLTDALVTALAVPHKDVEVRGVTVRVCGLGADKLMELNRRNTDGADVTFWILEQTLTDPETGDRLFGDDDARLRGLDMAAISELQDAVVEMMGVSERAKN